MAKVVLKQLEKNFPNGCHALRGLNLEIADGELVVLLGPSGSGKTTTLRMIAGLDRPSRGEIYIGGRIVNDDAPNSRDVAMVFQNYALYPHMSVFQNMAFGLKMRRIPRPEIDRRVRAAAQMLAIESLLDRRPGELSGGQRQRVALGRAIVREPKVFLFDEPLSNLDAQLRVQMRAEIAQLHRRLGATIIYVTHDQVEAMTLGQRIVLLDHGEIQQSGPPLEVYRRPANRFVASFIGSPAMNFFGGELRDGVFRFDKQDNGAAESIDVGRAIPNGPTVLGVRPEDVLTDGDGPGLGTVRLDVVEHLGHETFGHFKFANGRHIVRLPADAAVSPGDRMAISIRPDAFHLFATDGRRLN